MPTCIICGAGNCGGMCIWNAGINNANTQPRWWAGTVNIPPVAAEQVTKQATTTTTKPSQSSDYLSGYRAGVKACKEKIAEYKFDREQLGRDWSPRDVNIEGE